MGPIGCPKTSVTINPRTLRNIPVQRTSQVMKKSPVRVSKGRDCGKHVTYYDIFLVLSTSCRFLIIKSPPAWRSPSISCPRHAAVAKGYSSALKHIYAKERQAAATLSRAWSMMKIHGRRIVQIFLFKYILQT
jgi:hypothetical protein